MSSVRSRRKIFFVFLACLIGVGAVGFAVYATRVRSEGTKNSANVSSAEAIRLASQALKENGEKDDDGDGLLNWEENLWNTDPANPDTDNDGTKDGDEVKLGRNPLVAGPDDKLQQGVNSNEKIAAAKTVVEDKTLTGQVSRELFTNYMRAKTSGATIDENLEQQIIEQTFADKNFDPNYKIYSEKDISISTDTDLKVYGNKLGLAFYSSKTDDKTNEIEIVNSALTEDKKEELSKLDPIINGYNAIVQTLVLVPVPKDLVSYHLALLNSVSKLAGDIKGLSQVYTDPLIGLKSLQDYYTDLDAVRKSIFDLKSILTSRGVDFSVDEYGSVFMKTI